MTGTGDRGPGASSAGRAVLVLCLGNDLLRDDGIGLAIADEIEAELNRSPVFGPWSQPIVVRKTALSGFYLLDELTGFDAAVVVDAVRTGVHAPGTVHTLPFESLRSRSGPSPHAAGLPTVIRLGRQSGVPLPERIHVVAVEVDDIESIGEGLTPAVARAIPAARDAVLAALEAVR
ncbi:MAG: hydrogenase maturation protease [Acidobacteriota bacterium]